MNNENNKKLLELVEQHPDLPLIPATYYEVCADDWGYWAGRIEKVGVDYFYLNDEEERWYAGEDDIIDHLTMKFENSGEYDDMNQDDFNGIVIQKFNNLKKEGKIKEAIIMFIDV